MSTGAESTDKKMAEKAEMVRVARQLLSAVTKVLVLADRVVVKQLLAAKTKVCMTLTHVRYMAKVDLKVR